MGYRNSHGSSLLEIMIALLLSAIVLAEIFRYSYFIESSVNFSSSKIESIEKNNVLFAWLVRDIELSGYVGCVNAHSRETIIDDGSYLSNHWLVTSGNELVSQYMSTQQFLIASQTSANEVLIDGKNNFKVDDVVLIENCWEAETLKIKKISNVNYGTQKRLQFYQSIKIKNIQNAYVAKLIRHQYGIKKTTRKNENGQIIFSLYMTDIKNNSDEVLENISAMDISNSQGMYTLAITEKNASMPILLTARAHNA